MLSSTSGQILVADHNGVYVIKMVGDVRLTLCVPFNDYIEHLLKKNDFCTIVFDLVTVEGLDSTTLGLIAKIAVKSNECKRIKPVVISNDDGISRLLTSMGIDDICQLIQAPSTDYCSTKTFANLDADAIEEDAVKEKVLEAHCVLMSLNENNHETFKDLVKTLSQAP